MPGPAEHVASGEARWARHNNNSWHGKRCKLQRRARSCVKSVCEEWRDGIASYRLINEVGLHRAMDVPDVPAGAAWGERRPTPPLNATARFVGPAAHLTLEDLRRVFHLSRVDASAALGITVTALKRVCYDINIERWPFRKLTGLQQLQKNLESHPFQQKEKQQQKLQAVAHEYERVMQNPNRVVDSKLLALRTRTYKRRASARNKGGQATTASASPGADSDRDSARERAAASSEGEPELGVRASVSTAASGLQPKGRGKSGGVTSSAAVPRVAALREVSPGQDSQVLGSVGSLGSAGSRTLAAREVERQHSSALLAGSSGGAASRPGLATAAAAAPHQGLEGEGQEQSAAGLLQQLLVLGHPKPFPGQDSAPTHVSPQVPTDTAVWPMGRRRGGPVSELPAPAPAPAVLEVTTGAVPTGADPALASWMARLADDGDDMMMSDALLGSGFDMHMSSLSDVHAAIASLEPEPSAALLPSQPPPPVSASVTPGITKAAAACAPLLDSGDWFPTAGGPSGLPGVAPPPLPLPEASGWDGRAAGGPATAAAGRVPLSWMDMPSQLQPAMPRASSLHDPQPASSRPCLGASPTEPGTPAAVARALPGCQAYQLVSLEDLQAMSGSLLPHPTHDNQVQASYWATVMQQQRQQQQWKTQQQQQQQQQGSVCGWAGHASELLPEQAAWLGLHPRQQDQQWHREEINCQLQQPSRLSRESAKLELSAADKPGSPHAPFPSLAVPALMHNQPYQAQQATTSAAISTHQLPGTPSAPPLPALIPAPALHAAGVMMHPSPAPSFRPADGVSPSWCGPQQQLPERRAADGCAANDGWPDFPLSQTFVLPDVSKATPGLSAMLHLGRQFSRSLHHTQFDSAAVWADDPRSLPVPPPEHPQPLQPSTLLQGPQSVPAPGTYFRQHPQPQLAGKDAQWLQEPGTCHPVFKPPGRGESWQAVQAQLRFTDSAASLEAATRAQRCSPERMQAAATDP